MSGVLVQYYKIVCLAIGSLYCAIAFYAGLIYLGSLAIVCKLRHTTRLRKNALLVQVKS